LVIKRTESKNRSWRWAGMGRGVEFLVRDRWYGSGFRRSKFVLGCGLFGDPIDVALEL